MDCRIKKHNSKCLANTGIKLQYQITEWATDINDKTIFWLNDMAAMTESTIAQTVACWFGDKDYVGISFFFEKERKVVVL